MYQLKTPQQLTSGKRAAQTSWLTWLAVGGTVLPVQAEAGKAFSNGSFFWPIFWYTIGIPTAIMVVVSAVKALVKPQLPRRWLKTFLLSLLTWFGSLWLLYSIGNSGNHERATIDFWSFATFFVAPLLTLLVAVLVAFGKPAKPAEPLG